MTTGTVKWFDYTKGFGFIAADDGRPDIFVHISAVKDAGLSSLDDGQKIEFEVTIDRRSRKILATKLLAIG